MKTILIGLAAGVLGGGAVIGGAAVGLIPLDGLSRKPIYNQIAREDNSPQGDNGDLKTMRNEIAQLKRQLSEESGKRVKLEGELMTVSSSVRDKADKSSLELKADKSELAGLKAPPATTPDGREVSSDINASVRAVLVQIEAEKVEKARVEAQDKRVKELEQRKTNIRENLPKLLNNVLTEAKLDDVKKAEVNNIMVTHLTTRADILSEQRALEIDGKEVDRTAFKMRTDGLDTTTTSALMLLVDEATAKKVMNSASRMLYGMGGDGRPGFGRDRDRDRPDGGFGPRENPMSPRETPGRTPREGSRRRGEGGTPAPEGAPNGG